MVQLSPHQIRAVRSLGPKKILYGGTGSGKSRIAIVYFLSRVCHMPLKINGVGDQDFAMEGRPLYIITTAKKRDSLEWHEELASFGVNVDESGGSLKHPVVVDSWNNIKKYAKVAGAMFILDEQRLVGSGAWVKAFYQIARKNHWVILSATPGDVWLDYVPVFVANGFYKSKAEFLREHAVYNTYATYPKIDRYIGIPRLEKYRDSVLVHVDYTTSANRHILTVPVDYDEEKFELVRKKRWNPYENQPIKDAGELFRLMRRVSNESPSRLEALTKLTSRHPKLIVFYTFDYELDLLRQFCLSINVPHAEWNGHKHMEIPTTSSWIYMVQYTAGSEGWNCVTTDAIAFYSLSYSHKAFYQAMGRIDRMNTPYADLYYHVLRNQSEIDTAIWKTLQRKKSFNEAAYYKKMEKYDADHKPEEA